MAGSAAKTSFVIAGTSLAAAPISVGAVYFADELLPHQVTGVKKIIAEHIILPHLEKFEKWSSGLRKAHEKYDLRKRERLREMGAPVPEPDKNPTREERAFAISDALVDTSIALGVDTLAAGGMQKLMGVKDVPKIALAGLGATIGAIIAMPTLFARKAEDFHHNVLRKGLYKKMGFSPEDADRLAVVTTYATVPSLIGMVAEVGTNHYVNRR